MPRGFVISVGSQPNLLSLRNRVLTAHGYIVVPARNTEEAFDLFQSGVFDITIICHSIARREREELIARIKAADRFAPVLSLDMADFAERGLADDTVTNLDGAETLLSHLDTLVARIPPLPAHH